jgi:hypothetical protein
MLHISFFCQLQQRPYYEEHVFSREWFSGDGDLAGFKLWLPIGKVQPETKADKVF